MVSNKPTNIDEVEFYQINKDRKVEGFLSFTRFLKQGPNGNTKRILSRLLPILESITTNKKNTKQYFLVNYSKNDSTIHQGIDNEIFIPCADKIKQSLLDIIKQSKDLENALINHRALISYDEQVGIVDIKITSDLGGNGGENPPPTIPLMQYKDIKWDSKVKKFTQETVYFNPEEHVLIRKNGDIVDFSSLNKRLEIINFCR